MSIVIDESNLVERPPVDSCQIVEQRIAVAFKERFQYGRVEFLLVLLRPLLPWFGHEMFLSGCRAAE
jgi:hypothetical protein